MSISLDVFNVARVEVLAYSLSLESAGGQGLAHYQKLVFFDDDNCEIGDVTLFLAQPLAAIAIGDCSRLDGFQAPVTVAPAAFPTPALQLLSQVSGF
jgi:hypothetical protein